MAEAITRAMPISEVVRNLVPTGTNTHVPVHVDKVALAAEASPAAGGCFNWQNPLGVAVLAALVLDITTPSSGAASIDAGVAGSAAASADTLIDGASLATAAKALSSFGDGGTNGKPFRRVDAKDGANDYVTGTASADSSGLVGSAYVVYVPVS